MFCQLLVKKYSQGTADGPVVNPGEVECVTFSDSVVRVCPIDAEQPLGSLFFELISLVHLQFELAHRGVFLRGGLTVGDVYVDKSTVFGPAMVRAYELESSFAIYPRIVVDPVVFKEYFSQVAMQGHPHDANVDFEYIDNLLECAEDQIYFVDYLRQGKGEMDHPEEFQSYLKDHRERIASSLSEFSTLNRAKQKYLWLANYHNQVANAEYPLSDELQVQIADYYVT